MNSALVAAGNLAALAVLVAVPTALGERLRRTLRLALVPSLRLPVGFLLGWAVLAPALLALALAGAVAPGFFGALLLGAAALGRWRGLAGRARDLLPGFLGGLLLLPIALAPPFFYDALVYHLGLPWQILVEGRLVAHPENLFAAFPPLAQLAALPALSLGLDRAPALLHWWTFVAAAAALRSLARGLGAGPGLAALAAACLPALPLTMLVAPLPGAEGWAALALVSALALLVRRRPTPVALVGLLAGLACAARLQGLAWTVLLGGMGIALSRRRSRAALGFAGAWLAGSAVWWGKNLLLLHSPWAPVGWYREGVATLLRDAGSGVGAGSLAAALASAWSALAPHVPYLIPVLLAAVLAVYRRPRRETLVLTAVIIGAVIAWAATGSLARFLTPAAAACLALAAAAGRGRAGWVGGLTLAAAAAFSLLQAAGELARFGGPAIVGADAAVLRHRLASTDPTEAFRRCERLPLDSRVLFIAEPRGLGFPRRFTAPSQVDVSPLREPLERATGAADVATWLRRQGYTHLLINWGELARLRRDYPVAPWRTLAGLARLRELLAGCGAPVAVEGDVEVVALPPVV